MQKIASMNCVWAVLNTCSTLPRLKHPQLHYFWKLLFQHTGSSYWVLTPLRYQKCQVQTYALLSLEWTLSSCYISNHFAVVGTPLWFIHRSSLYDRLQNTPLCISEPTHALVEPATSRRVSSQAWRCSAWWPFSETYDVRATAIDRVRLSPLPSSEIIETGPRTTPIRA